MSGAGVGEASVSGAFTCPGLRGNPVRSLSRVRGRGAASGPVAFACPRQERRRAGRPLETVADGRGRGPGERRVSGRKGLAPGDPGTGPGARSQQTGWNTSVRAAGFRRPAKAVRPPATEMSRAGCVRRGAVLPARYVIQLPQGATDDFQLGVVGHEDLWLPLPQEIFP